MESALIFRNGTVVNANGSLHADLLVVGEKIARIGAGIEAPGALELDCAGRYLLPGGVDPHTHFDLPMFGTVSSDDHYTGHKAAAYGGTTTVMDFIPQEVDDLEACIEAWRKKGDKSAIDYGFHMNITSFSGRVGRQIPALRKMGITTLKVFMAYNGRLRLDDASIFQVMRIAEDNDMLVMLHAENGDVIDVLVTEALNQGKKAPIWHARTRPAWGAVDAVLRGCALAAQAGARLYIVHMNAGGEVDMLSYARERGVRVMGETCPQYLQFTDDVFNRPDAAKWVCSPPVRGEADRHRLWKGLEERTIQVLGTDHCPFFYNGKVPIEYEGQEVAIPGKELGVDDFTRIPNGLPVVGDRLPVFWTYAVHSGRFSKEDFVALTSTNAAKIFGLYPQKGALLEGSDADILVWDPEKVIRYGVSVARHRTDYNLFEGIELSGFPEQVYLRGRCLVDAGEWKGTRGYGRFLHRTAGEWI